MSDELIHYLKFDRDGLIPVVVQDCETGAVLMHAHMNSESLARTLQSGETWFWDQSRNDLWHKGALSGNRQQVVDLRPDCDGDALLVRVNSRGPTCHTGASTCFSPPKSQAMLPTGTTTEVEPVAISTPSPQEIDELGGQLSLVNVPAMDLGILLQDFYKLIAERKDQHSLNSYTTYLFDSGLDKILKKVGEEATETIIAAKNEGTKELKKEISDLLFHLLVLMVQRDISLRDVVAELKHRADISIDPQHLNS